MGKTSQVLYAVCFGDSDPGTCSRKDFYFDLRVRARQASLLFD